MTRAKSYTSYPSVFSEMLDKFKEDPTKPVLLKAQSQSMARNYQLDFYGFKAAYMKAGLHLPGGGGYGEVDGLGSKVVQLDSGQWALEIHHRDHSPVAEAMRAALIERELLPNAMQPLTILKGKVG